MYQVVWDGLLSCLKSLSNVLPFLPLLFTFKKINYLIDIKAFWYIDDQFIPKKVAGTAVNRNQASL